MSSDGSDSEQPDLEALQLTRKESRTVLDHQLALLNDLDDKATRTGRGAAIILGILITAAGVIGPDQIGRLPDRVVELYAVSAGFLFVTFVLGTITYVTSNLTMGISPDYIEEVQTENYSQREWLNVLLDDYELWIVEMRSVNNTNSKFLTATHVFFGLSGGVLLAATTLLAMSV